MGFFDDPNAPQQPGGDAPYGGKTGAALANDPQYIRDQITKGFQQKFGRNPTDDEMNQWVGYATKPDTYSDGTIHQGWNGYLYDRLATPGHEGASDPRLAGTDTIVGRAQAAGGGFDGAMALPAGYQMGSFSGGGSYPLASVNAPGLMAPWTTPFQSPGGFRSPGDFTPTTAADMEADPGYQFRKEQGEQGIMRNAAAAGTLRTGGALKDLATFNSGLASQEYGNVDARRFRNNETAYGRAFNENNTAYNRALGEYQMANNIFNQNQSNQFGRLFQVASLGQNAAAGVGNSGVSFAGQGSNTIVGAGQAAAGGVNAGANARAGGIVGAANARYWGV